MPDLTDTDDGPEHWRTVNHGNFLPCGLTPLEHVHLAVEASRVPVELNIPEDLLTNIKWLFNHSMVTEHDEPQVDDVEHREMVDAFGESMVAEWRGKVSDLHQATIAWIANAPSRISPAVQGWNGRPFIHHLCQKSGHSDPTLVHDLQQGFPMIGKIPAYGVSARTKLKVSTTGPSVSKVWSSRITNNHKL